MIENFEFITKTNQTFPLANVSEYCRASCRTSADKSGSVPLTENATSIFSQVTKGNRPVKNAEVTATIEGVGSDSFTIPLWDNGAGADLIANDGVYSRFFFTTNDDTFYTVSCHARSSGNAEVLEGLVRQGGNSTG